MVIITILISVSVFAAQLPKSQCTTEQMCELNFDTPEKSVILVNVEDRLMSSFEELRQLGFVPQRYRSKQVNPADVAKLSNFLKLNNLRTATQNNLLFHLATECFQNEHSVHYIKKLVLALSKNRFEQ